MRTALAAALACLEPPILSKASAIALDQNSQNLLLLDATVEKLSSGGRRAAMFKKSGYPVPFFSCLVGAIVSDVRRCCRPGLVVERNGDEG